MMTLRKIDRSFIVTYDELKEAIRRLMKHATDYVVDSIVDAVDKLHCTENYYSEWDYSYYDDLSDRLHVKGMLMWIVRSQFLIPADAKKVCDNLYFDLQYGQIEVFMDKAEYKEARAKKRLKLSMEAWQDFLGEYEEKWLSKETYTYQTLAYIANIFNDYTRLIHQFADIDEESTDGALDTSLNVAVLEFLDENDDVVPIISDRYAPHILSEDTKQKMADSVRRVRITFEEFDVTSERPYDLPNGGYQCDGLSNTMRIHELLRHLGQHGCGVDGEHGEPKYMLTDSSAYKESPHNKNKGVERTIIDFRLRRIQPK